MTEQAITQQVMKQRTKSYALRVIRVVSSLQNNVVGRNIGGQLLRAGTSVAANYRAACRARSRADFLSKLGIVEEETDESLFWQELLVEAGILEPAKLVKLMKEGNEILSIIVATRKTVRASRT
jgi:four helix bundle protein